MVFSFFKKRKSIKNKTFSGFNQQQLEKYQQKNKNEWWETYDINIKNIKIKEFKGKSGLKNLRNSCYINSALQCLISIKPISNYFLSKSFFEDLNIVNLTGSQGILAINYHIFIKNYLKNDDYFSPKIFIKSIKNYNNKFDGVTQEDSQEFLSFIWDILLEDTNKVLKKPYFEIKDYKKGDLSLYANNIWNNFKKRNNSILVDNFYGQYKTTINCTNCNFISYNFEPFNILTLPLHDSNKELSIYLINFRKVNNTIKIMIPEKDLFINSLDFILKCYDIGIDEIKIITTESGYINNIIENYNDFTNKDVIDNKKYFFIQRIWNSKFMGENIKNLKGNLTVINIFLNEKKLGISRLIFIPSNYDSFSLFTLVYINLIKDAKKLLKDFNFINNGSYSQLKEEYKKYFYNGRYDFFEIYLNDSLIEKKSSVKLNFLIKNNKIRVQILNKSPFNSIKFNTTSKVNLNYNKGIDYNWEYIIKNWSKKEKLDQDNMWKCSKCKELNLATIKIEINKLPKILIIHLKKFENNSKLNKKVSFNINNLNLSNYIVDKSYSVNNNYELFATIDHLGYSIDGGHYIANVRSWGSKNWNLFNDKRISPINETDVITEDNYILFFKLKT